MRSLTTCLIAGAAMTTMMAQSITPQPFTSYTAGTVAQDLTTTPKGGWTYMVGSTTDPHYPVTPDAFDRTCGTDGRCNEFQGRFGPERLADIVLTVFDAAGRITYSTFLGGAGRDDNPRLALARDGTLWIGGNTTVGGFEHVVAGCVGDLSIVRFEYTLRRVEQQQCLPGVTLSDLIPDSDGTIWIVGISGAQVPTVNALQPVLAGQIDMFIAHLSPLQSTPLFSSYIGGDRLDAAAALAITSSGDIAIAGRSTSTNFPLVRPARSVAPTSIVRGDAVIAVLDRSGRFFEFSTYWGGGDDDFASGVAVGASGALYAVGSTASADLPVSSGAYDRTCDTSSNATGCRDAFVTSFSATGEALASTFLGGSGLDSGTAIALRPDGQVVLLGSTQSPDFPIVGGVVFQRWRPGVNFEHAYLALMTPGLDRLSYSTFVGDEQLLPNVPRFAARGLFAYVAGQVGVLTGAPGFGNYLGAVRLP